MKPITPRQQQTLDFIKWYIAKHGYSPSVREIGQGIFLTAHSSVCAVLDQLEDQGYIERKAGKSRSIRIVGQGITLRPEVQWFAEQMEQALRENDYKSGWKDEHQSWLLGELHRNAGKIFDSGYSLRRLVNTANFAMMIADNARGGK
jgi:SOS-response transcriptional repressor LexA